MRILTKILLGLLMSGFVVSHSFAAGEVNEETRSIQMLLDTLDKNITALQFLMGQIETEKSADREVLVYRQDERAFRLLADYDELARQIASLPEDSQQKKDVSQQLTEFASNLDTAIFNRIDEIKQQVIKHNAELNKLKARAQEKIDAEKAKLKDKVDSNVEAEKRKVEEKLKGFFR